MRDTYVYRSNPAVTGDEIRINSLGESYEELSRKMERSIQGIQTFLEEIQVLNNEMETYITTVVRNPDRKTDRRYQTSLLNTIKDRKSRINTLTEQLKKSKETQEQTLKDRDKHKLKLAVRIADAQRRNEQGVQIPV